MTKMWQVLKYCLWGRKMKKDIFAKENRIILITWAIAIVTIIAGISFIYIPFLKAQDSLKIKIAREKDKNALIGEIKALVRYLDIYKKRVPEGRSSSWLLKEISDMAKKEGLTIINIKAEEPERRASYTRLSVVIDTASSYHQLSKFVSGIETSEKFLRIEELVAKRLDVEEKFIKDASSFNSFDVGSHIVISTILWNE